MRADRVCLAAGTILGTVSRIKRGINTFFLSYVVFDLNCTLTGTQTRLM